MVCFVMLISRLELVDQRSEMFLRGGKYRGCACHADVLSLPWHFFISEVAISRGDDMAVAHVARPGALRGFEAAVLEDVAYGCHLSLRLVAPPRGRRRQ